VRRSERNANAGVRGQLMTETFVRFPDRIENLRDESGDLCGRLDRRLDDGEFVAAKPRHEIGRHNAPVQAHRHRFQQFIADQVT